MNRRTNIIITGILAVASLLIGAALHNVYNATIDNIRRLEQQNERNSAVSNEDLMKELKRLTKKVKAVKDELKTMKESNKAMAKDVSTAKDIALAFDTCWDRVCPTEGPTSSTPTTNPTSSPTSSPTTEGPTSIPTTSPTTTNPTSTPMSTREILEDFYESTNGPTWNESGGWMTEIPYCEWYGIYCANGKLLGIWLGSNYITGTFPEALGSLTNLQQLYLAGNQMYGVIPNVFSDLTKLKVLSLLFNGFTGSVPQSICDLKENHDLYSFEIDSTVSCQCCD